VTPRARLLACLCAFAGACGVAQADEAPLACPPPLPLVAQATHVPPRDRGLLWRATRDGRSLYLYGTLHLGRPHWERLGPATSAALRASDVLALEVDPADPALAPAMAEAARHAPALTDALSKRLRSAFDRACVLHVPGEGLAAMHPLLQALVLTLAEARWLGLGPEFASEQLLLRHARGTGQPLVALETALQQLRALIPGDPAEGMTLLDQSLEALEDHSARRVLASLVAAWERGDDAVLADYERWCECATTPTERAYMRRMNDARNPALADAIEAQHRHGRRVFAAVGALHMAGPQALPALLAQRGFKVERVWFGP
jgi:uncharacterized protein YbaP (TraB family)